MYQFQFHGMKDQFFRQTFLALQHITYKYLRMKIITGLMGILLLAASCHSATTPATATDTTAAAPAAMPAKKAAKFDAALVDNKKDPSCGMPVTAGIEDTLHYKNKVLGFCSKECKDAFTAKPDSFTIVFK